MCSTGQCKDMLDMRKDWGVYFDVIESKVINITRKTTKIMGTAMIVVSVYLFQPYL
jgi:hypothetical protein